MPRTLVSKQDLYSLHRCVRWAPWSASLPGRALWPSHPPEELWGNRIEGPIRPGQKISLQPTVGSSGQFGYSQWMGYLLRGGYVEWCREISLDSSAMIPFGSCNNQSKLCFPQNNIHNYRYVIIAHISLSMCDRHELTHTSTQQILPSICGKWVNAHITCVRVIIYTDTLTTGYEGVFLYSQLLIAVLAVPGVGKIYGIVISIAHNTYFLNGNVCHFLICPKRWFSEIIILKKQATMGEVS